jgi:hypothetical protein
LLSTFFLFAGFYRNLRNLAENIETIENIV